MLAFTEVVTTTGGRLVTDLHQRAVALGLPLVQQLHRAGVLVLAAEDGLRRLHQTLERAEGVVHAAGLIAGVHHAVRAARVAALGAVVVPLDRLHQLLEGVRVAVLQQVAGLLPAEDGVRRHAPRRAGQVLLAHQELHEDGRRVELPGLLAVRKDRAEHLAALRAAQEVLLVGRLVIGVAGRDHHALHAGVHHLVEVAAHRVRVGAIEQRRVRRHAEARIHRGAGCLPSRCRSRPRGIPQSRGARARRPHARRS